MILVVEDDEAIGQALVGVLESQGFGVALIGTGGEAVTMVVSVRPDLVLLDLGLPDIDGVAVCRRIRTIDAALPIVMLTARHSEIDVVMGLDAGADDYVTKPFSLAELLARVRAHLRRPTPTPSEAQISVGDVVIDRESRRVWVSDKEIDLRAREFELLAYLADAAGTAVPRERIMTEVWDEHWFGSTKTLDVTMASLRRKLGEAAGVPSRITALRGVGYRFERP